MKEHPPNQRPEAITDRRAKKPTSKPQETALELGDTNGDREEEATAKVGFNSKAKNGRGSLLQNPPRTAWKRLNRFTYIAIGERPEPRFLRCARRDNGHNKPDTLVLEILGHRITWMLTDSTIQDGQLSNFIAAIAISEGVLLDVIMSPFTQQCRMDVLITHLKDWSDITTLLPPNLPVVMPHRVPLERPVQDETTRGSFSGTVKRRKLVSDADIGMQSHQQLSGVREDVPPTQAAGQSSLASLALLPPSAKSVQTETQRPLPLDPFLDLSQALSRHAATHARIAHSVETVVRATVAIRRMPTWSFAELIEHVSANDDLNFINQGHANATLIFDPSQLAGLGTFKLAVRARLLSAGRQETAVVLKLFKALTSTNGSVEQRGLSRKLELERYIGECAAMAWAYPLQELANDWGRQLLQSIKPPPGKRLALDVDSLPRYVDAWCGTMISWQAAHFILEPEIPWKGKYINNNGALNAQALDNPELAQTLAYLLYCQHTLFRLTKGRCLVGDYQGGLSLLSDPQVITTSSGAGAFANGNCCAALEAFKEKHTCSAYCCLANYDQLGPDHYGERQLKLYNLSIFVDN